MRSRDSPSIPGSCWVRRGGGYTSQLSLYCGAMQRSSACAITDRNNRRLSVKVEFIKVCCCNLIAPTRPILFPILSRKCLRRPATIHCPKGTVIDFPRYIMKCSGENLILRGIVHVVSGFPLHFMFYRRNLNCSSTV